MRFEGIQYLNMLNSYGVSFLSLTERIRAASSRKP